MPPTGPAHASFGARETPSLRVLFLIEATFAGVRRHVVDLITGMHDRHPGVEIHLGYATDRADAAFVEFLADLRARGTSLVEVPMQRGPDRSDLSAVRRVRGYVRKANIDIVHAHSAKAGFIGRLAARTVRGTSSVYTPNASPFRLSPSYRALEMVGGFLLGDAVIAVSPSERDELIGERIAPRSRVHMVLSGIPNAADVAPVRLGDQTVGTAGRITAQKAPERFVEIMARVVERAPATTFVWIGDGEDRATVETLAASQQLHHNLQISGWVDDASPLVAGLDVFLLPSIYESFGYVTVEAMRLGRPTVVSAVPGSVDVVDDGRTGFVIEPDDIDGYADAIVSLLEDGSLRQRMGDAGRQRWQEQLHADRMVDETVAVYRQITAGRRSSR